MRVDLAPDGGTVVVGFLVVFDGHRELGGAGMMDQLNGKVDPSTGATHRCDVDVRLPAVLPVLGRQKVGERVLLRFEPRGSAVSMPVGHVPDQAVAVGERGIAIRDGARKGALACVLPLVSLEAAGQAPSVCAAFVGALVRAFACVDTQVRDQPVVKRECLAALLALMRSLAGVGESVVLQVARVDRPVRAANERARERAFAIGIVGLFVRVARPALAEPRLAALEQARVRPGGERRRERWWAVPMPGVSHAWAAARGWGCFQLMEVL